MSGAKSSKLPSTSESRASVHPSTLAKPPTHEKSSALQLTVVLPTVSTAKDTVTQECENDKSTEMIAQCLPGTDEQAQQTSEIKSNSPHVLNREAHKGPNPANEPPSDLHSHVEEKSQSTRTAEDLNHVVTSKTGVKAKSQLPKKVAGPKPARNAELSNISQEKPVPAKLTPQLKKDTLCREKPGDSRKQRPNIVVATQKKSYLSAALQPNSEPPQRSNTKSLQTSQDKSWRNVNPKDPRDGTMTRNEDQVDPRPTSISQNVSRSVEMNSDNNVRPEMKPKYAHYAAALANDVRIRNVHGAEKLRDNTVPNGSLPVRHAHAPVGLVRPIPKPRTDLPRPWPHTKVRAPRSSASIKGISHPNRQSAFDRVYKTKPRKNTGRGERNTANTKAPNGNQQHVISR